MKLILKGKNKMISAQGEHQEGKHQPMQTNEGANAPATRKLPG